MHHPILEISQFFLRFKQTFHLLLQLIVTPDQLSDVILLFEQLLFEGIQLPFFMDKFVFIVVFHAHFVFIHDDFHLISLLFYGSHRLQLNGFNITISDTQLNHSIFVLSI
jgi:hypothetical protein